MGIAERRSFHLAAIALAFLLVAFYFASQFVLIEIAARRLLAPILLALAEALAIVGVGALLRRALDDGSRDRLAFDFAIGYPLFGTICYLLGWISTSKAMSVVILLLGVSAGAFALRLYATRSDVESIPLTVTTIAAGTLIAIAAASAFVTAQAPPITLDELAYHLAVPQTWILEGRVRELPLISHSYFPFGVESADIPLLAILGTDGAIASHFLHLIAAVATTILIFSWLKRRCSIVTALCVTAAVVTIPALLVTAGVSWNDWPLLAICIALLMACYPFETDEISRGAIAVAIAAGLLTKYTFAAYAIPLLAPLVVLRKRGMAYPLIAGGAIGSVFFLRNLILTGNPFAPLFGDHTPDVAGYRAAANWQALINGYIFDGRFIDESIGITAIIFLAAFWICWRRVEERAMLTVAAGLMVVFVLLLALAPSSRILLPFLATFTMLGGSALDDLSPQLTRGIALVGAALQLFLGVHFLSLTRPFDLLSGARSAREYVLDHRPALGDFEWMSAAVPPDARVLIVGVNELFWSPRRARGGGNFDGERVSSYLSSEDLLSRLRRDGITHVAILPRTLRVEASDDVKSREREVVLSREALLSLQSMLQRSAREVSASQERRIYELIGRTGDR